MITAGGFDPNAANAIGLLLREFEMLFLTVQLCFAAGLVSFLGTILTRVWVIYNKASERPLASSISGMLGFLSLLILKLLSMPVANTPPFHVKVFRYARFMWNEVLWRPSALVEIGLVAALVAFTQSSRVQVNNNACILDSRVGRSPIACLLLYVHDAQL